MIKRFPSNSQVEGTVSLKDFPILISGCLLGIHCRYDGEEAGSSDIVDFTSLYNFIPFCPEQLGGLPTPRPSANIVGGDGRDVLSGKARVINSRGEDVTDAFRRGAEESLRLARLSGARVALLRERSPSCGVSTSYFESSGNSGIGVTAAILESAGIKIVELGPRRKISKTELTVLLGHVYIQRDVTTQ